MSHGGLHKLCPGRSTVFHLSPTCRPRPCPSQCSQPSARADERQDKRAVNVLRAVAGTIAARLRQHQIDLRRQAARGDDECLQPVSALNCGGTNRPWCGRHRTPFGRLQRQIPHRRRPPPPHVRRTPPSPS
ncbi:hypothetical protein TcCL_ESM02130 [Trypanosoma cruzi]|nr:hypothetical protein TcCL_ESM02130 [Trypanosoma cruzi]